MQMESEKGNDRNESVTSQITTRKALSDYTTLLDTEEIHSVVCKVPLAPASFSKDEDQRTYRLQRGAQEENGLRDTQEEQEEL